MSTPASTPAVVYGRQSQHNDKSIEQQLTIGRSRADSEGWDLRHAYSDGVSASRHATKTRDDWPRLLADVDNGHVRVVWLWESSRGDRRPSTWLAFLDSCRDRGVKIYVETDHRCYDMDVPRDWRNLAEDGIDNAYESEKTRMRVMRGLQAVAAEGRPHGSVPFGYKRIYDQRTGEFVAQEPHEPEAAVIRELYDRLRKGHTLRAIAADFESHGVRTRTGKVFSQQHLRVLALRATYAGRRVHRPGVRGDRVNGDDAVTAVWPALVDDETYWAVYGKLTDPARTTTRGGAAKHVFSSIARCDPCGGPLVVSYQFRDTGSYQCRHRSCVRVDKVELDDLAEAAILAHLTHDDIYEAWSHRGDDADLSRLRGELEQARAELADTENATPANLYEAKLFARLAETQAKRVAELENRERDLTLPSALRHLIEPGADVAARWKAAPVSAKREVARLLLSPGPGLLGELRVIRDPRRGPGRTPAAERVRWRHED